MNEQSRKEFESWIKSERPEHLHSAALNRLEMGGYAIQKIQNQFEAWQASREKPIKHPPYVLGGANDREQLAYAIGITSCKEAIEAAGYRWE